MYFFKKLIKNKFKGNNIEIIYDANGGKLRKMVKVGATLQYEQDYLGGLEYRKVGSNAKRLEAV